jgi:hypothetical protein
MINETPRESININRRRLAKGGLAAPIVLATLASKHALADPLYACTVSGKLSNNTSPHGPNPDGNNTCDTGETADTWGSTDKTVWPSELQDVSGNVKSFKDVFGLDLFFSDTNTPKTPARLDQVCKRIGLYRNNGGIWQSDNKRLVFAAEAAALLANFYKSTSWQDFPVAGSDSPTMIIEMFTAANANANNFYTYTKNGSNAKLHRDELIAYFQCLNGSGSCDFTFDPL